MATAGAIVKDALRSVNIIPIGQDPSAAEMTEGLARLNTLVRSLFGGELGVLLRDWYVADAWSDEQEEMHPLTPLSGDLTLTPWRSPPANTRLVTKIGNPTTVLLTGSPADGARMAVVNAGSTANLTMNAGGRLIDGQPYITNTLAAWHEKEWFYRAERGEWVQIVNPLLEATEMPLPSDFDDLFITGLAQALAPRYGVNIEQSIGDRYTDMLTRAVARYHQGAASPAELRDMLRTTPHG